MAVVALEALLRLAGDLADPGNVAVVGERRAREPVAILVHAPGLGGAERDVHEVAAIRVGIDGVAERGHLLGELHFPRGLLAERARRIQGEEHLSEVVVEGVELKELEHQPVSAIWLITSVYCGDIFQIVWTVETASPPAGLVPRMACCVEARSLTSASVKFGMCGRCATGRITDRAAGALLATSGAIWRRSL